MKLTQEQWDQCVQEYAKGASANGLYKFVAAKFKIYYSPVAIRRRLRKDGVIRTASEAQFISNYGVGFEGVKKKRDREKLLKRIKQLKKFRDKIRKRINDLEASL